MRMRKKKKRPRRSNFKTFTKNWVEKLMIIAVIDLQLSYALAFLGREQIAEALSQTVVVEIIGVMLGYFGKSYFETRAQEKVRLLEDEAAPAQPVEMEEEL